MPHVLIVHESPTVRGDLTRACLGEGFTVAEADSVAAAAREIWAGNFDAALVSNALPRVGGATPEEHLRNLAPELITLAIGKESASKLARKVAELIDGGAVAA